MTTAPRPARRVAAGVAVVAGLAAVVIVLVAAVTRKPAPRRSKGDSSSVSTPAQESTTAGKGAQDATSTTSPPATALDFGTASVALKTAVSRAAAVSDGSSILVLGGLPPTHQTTAANVRVDLGAGTVSPAGQLAVATHDAAAVRLHGSVFLFGGGASTVTDAVQQIDPSGATRVVAHLPSPRADLRAVVVGDRAVIVGGYDGQRSLATVLSTTDGTHFSTVATLPRAVRYPAVAAIGQKVYVFGGEDGNTPLADVQVVDLAAGTASRIGALPEPRGEAVALSSGDRIWIAGGRTGVGIVGSVVGWDTAAGSATPAGSLPSPVADAVAVTIGDTTYLVGGEFKAAVSTIFTARPR